MPITLGTALAIKLHDGGPVLFRQTGIGCDGLPFGCLKFRSMVVDAERLRAGLEVATNAAPCSSSWPTTRG